MNEMLSMNLVNTGIKTAAMLFIVLGLLILVLLTMKRFMLSGRKGKGDLLINICSSLPLSAKERIAVVEVAGEKLVLGVAPGRISFLTKLNDSQKEHTQAHVQ